MNPFRLFALAFFGTALSAVAQTATLTASTETLSPAGGSVVFTATANYQNEPGALGWSIALPATWTLESVSGSHIPQIAPEVGSTGTLEFAYTSVPPSRAEFTIIARYPAGQTTATAKPTVIVRGGGQLTTLNPPSVELRAPEANRPTKSRN